MCPKRRIFCRLWREREAGNQRCVGLQYWSYGGYKVCGGSTEWPTCQTHQCDRKGTSLWTMFHTRTARLELHSLRLIKTQLGIKPDARFPNSFFQSVYATPCQSYPTQDLSSAATSGVNRAPKINEGVDHFNLSICSVTWTVEHVAGLQNWTILVSDQLI